MNHRKVRTLVAVLFAFGAFDHFANSSIAKTPAKEPQPIDTMESRVTVHVFKAGLFAAFADNHEIEAPISDGTIDTGAQRVRVVFDARRMKVLDPALSASKREQVQQRMLGPDVLDSARFPQITFTSTSIERIGSAELRVRGELSLHGVTRPLTLDVRTEAGRYVGSSSLKQSEFGITPVRIAGGTVKVKDEIQTVFDIRGSRNTR